MRIRRSILTAAVLALTLSATTLPAATRDVKPGTPVDRGPSIVVKIKRFLDRTMRAFEGPSIPIPSPAQTTT